MNNKLFMNKFILGSQMLFKAIVLNTNYNLKSVSNKLYQNHYRKEKV